MKGLNSNVGVALESSKFISKHPFFQIVLGPTYVSNGFMVSSLTQHVSFRFNAAAADDDINVWNCNFCRIFLRISERVTWVNVGQLLDIDTQISGGWWLWRVMAAAYFVFLAVGWNLQRKTVCKWEMFAVLSWLRRTSMCSRCLLLEVSIMAIHVKFEVRICFVIYISLF